MDILLIAGLWLDRSAWDEVVPALEERGHRPVALTLPGQGDGRAAATLDEQVATVLAAVDAAPGKTVVVGHSAASTLAWLAADRRPDKVAAVVLIGGFPAADGARYADFFKVTDGVMPFPGWAAFEGPDSADLSEDAKTDIAAAAIPVPEGVTKGVVRLTDARRYDVPVVLVCPRVLPHPGPRMDRQRRATRARQGKTRPAGRHRLGPLADGHQTGRAGHTARHGGHR